MTDTREYIVNGNPGIIQVKTNERIPVYHRINGITVDRWLYNNFGTAIRNPVSSIQVTVSDRCVVFSRHGRVTDGMNYIAGTYIQSVPIEGILPNVHRIVQAAARLLNGGTQCVFMPNNKNMGLMAVHDYMRHPRQPVEIT